MEAHINKRPLKNFGLLATKYILNENFAITIQPSFRDVATNNPMSKDLDPP